jgi:outer membrane protein OmpA-like peptidoglycan-associated protein
MTLAGVLISGGCATKKYVAKTVDPVRDKVDTVASTTDKQGKDISQQGQQISQQGDEIKKQGGDIEKAQTDISANRERAMAADSRASDAIGRASDAMKKADQVGTDLSGLRQVVANLDDYKAAGNTVISFGFNKDALTQEAKDELDKLVSDKTTMKRYFVAVEGFTDKTGTVAYNNQLSRRRAEAVMQYLVAKHDIPVYRIHIVGLGEEKPADEGRDRAARAKNRRVEVTIFTADNTSTRASASAPTGDSK